MNTFPSDSQNLKKYLYVRVRARACIYAYMDKEVRKRKDGSLNVTIRCRFAQVKRNYQEFCGSKETHTKQNLHKVLTGLKESV